MVVPAQTGNETNLKLPFFFIFTSMVALVGSQVLLLLQGDFMVAGVFRVPGIWAAAHLFILGWALMVAMGAMYQLVPVAFLTPIWSEKFGFVQFFVTAIGVFWFAHALFYTPGSALFPGILAVLGILMFLFQMFMTLRKQAKPNILTLYVGTALFFLLTTIGLGITLLAGMRYGMDGNIYMGIIKTHVLLGTTGWFTLLIFGFSYKMVPMFALSHGYTMAPANYVYPIYAAGLVAAIISFFIDSEALLTVALFLLFAGFALFVYHISIIVKKRFKKKLDISFIFALIAIISGGLLHLAAFIAAVFGYFNAIAGPLLFLYIVLWIDFSIIGYLYKIVPFLWWTAKYSKAIGKQNVPTLKDMINDKAAVPIFSGMVLGIIGVAAAIFSGSKMLYLPSEILFAAACVAFCFSIGKVVTK